MRPPIIPKLSHILDTSNFRALKDDTVDRLAHDRGVRDFDLAQSDPFRDFESVNLTHVKYTEEGDPEDPEFSALLQQAIVEARDA